MQQRDAVHYVVLACDVEEEAAVDEIGLDGGDESRVGLGFLVALWEGDCWGEDGGVERFDWASGGEDLRVGRAEGGAVFDGEDAVWGRPFGAGADFEEAGACWGAAFVDDFAGEPGESCD